MKETAPILRAAEQVADILRYHRIDAVVIGAVALAAYHYVRQTRDIDLGVNADLVTLRVTVHGVSLPAFPPAACRTA